MSHNSQFFPYTTLFRSEQRRGDEDRRVGPGDDPDDEREREVLQGRAAEEQQRADRQQRDERRRERAPDRLPERDVRDRDRKSTRLNYSHVAISYAVFCL